MMAASRIPSLLEPLLRLPPETSLIVLTNVLGASTNWLVQRFLSSWRASPDRRPAVEGNGIEAAAAKDEEISVVLLSFLRDYAFWKDGAGRAGVDLDTLSKKGRFTFIDGLSGLFSPTSGHGPKSTSSSVPGKRLLAGPTAQDLRRELDCAIADMLLRSPDSKIVLILDNPDLLLAATGNGVPGEGLRETLLDIREKVHSTLVTLATDEPLISAQATSLEKEHAAFALSLAHEAEMIISLRMLDTGTAKDVSGVLRVTHGGGASGGLAEEQELLYFVSGDGGVRVFERGQ